MRNSIRVLQLLQELKSEMTTSRELSIIEECENKLNYDMPSIEIINDKQKKFAGFTFYKNKKGRYSCTVTFHRFLWIYYNGAIPNDYDIHHMDFNKENNHILNLELLTKDEHKQIHLEQKLKKTPEKKSKFVCINCGCEYEAANRGNNKYCSDKCHKEYEHKTAVEVRVCVVCCKEFTVYKYDSTKCCSRTCANKFQQRQEVKICPICGKIFSDAVSKHRKCCSVECAVESMKRQTLRICPECGKTFSVPVSSKQKCCSIECANKSKQCQEIKICPTCGKEFSFARSRDKKYCSRKCYFASRKCKS